MALLVVVPVAVVLALRWVAPPTSAFMLQARFGGLGDEPSCARVAYRWVSWPRISEHAKLAVIAAEDQRFARHWGLDLESIGDAIEDRGDGAPMRGASTISQQVVKNLFLWPGRSWLRKGAEAYLALVLELTWPKQRILEVYLNVAQFGPCTFGVGAASRGFFGVAPSALSRRQAALLAAVLPNPVALRADRPSSYVEDRVQWIQGQMRQLGGARYLERL